MQSSRQPRSSFDLPAQLKTCHHPAPPDGRLGGDKNRAWKRGGDHPFSCRPGPCRCSSGRPSFGGGFRRARCRPRGVREESGSLCTRTALRPDTMSIRQVAGVIAVAPRPAERRCGSALLGRGRERPPYSACLIRHGDGWDVQGNPTVAWGRSRPSIPCGKTNVGSSTEMPTMDTDAVLATTCKDRTA